MNIKELRGTKLKKDLEFKTAVMRYHNKNKHRNSNFGFTLIDDKDRWFSLDGRYNQDGNIVYLNFGLFSEAGSRISNIENYKGFLAELKNKIGNLQKLKV